MFQLKAIVPNRRILPLKSIDILEKSTEDLMKRMKTHIRQVTYTWSKRVTFQIYTSYEEGNLVVFLWTDNKLFNMLDQGTKPHDIFPKSAKVLRFQRGYSPKTYVGYVGSSIGGPSGDFVSARSVHHPGTEARHWFEAVAKIYESMFVKVTEDAMKKIAKGG